MEKHRIHINRFLFVETAYLWNESFEAINCLIEEKSKDLAWMEQYKDEECQKVIETFDKIATYLEKAGYTQ